MQLSLVLPYNLLCYASFEAKIRFLDQIFTSWGPKNRWGIFVLTSFFSQSSSNKKILSRYVAFNYRLYERAIFSALNKKKIGVLHAIPWAECMFEWFPRLLINVLTSIINVLTSHQWNITTKIIIERNWAKMHCSFVNYMKVHFFLHWIKKELEYYMQYLRQDICLMFEWFPRLLLMSWRHTSEIT